VVLLWGAFSALVYAKVRIPVVGPFVTVVSVYAATAAYRFALGQSERRLIKRAFKSYVAPAIVDQMLRDPSKLQLQGEEYDVTVLFSDLEGFTTISERFTPEQLRVHITTYFTAMVDLLLLEHATLDKFIGDAIMVYFGCPIADPAHPIQACRGALAMQRRQIELNREWARQGMPELRTRIGVNTGPVVAGNLGTATTFNYTIIGDTVNLASRLEGVNKEYGTRTIIAEETWNRVKSAVETRELDFIRVKGKAQPVVIHELVAMRGELDHQSKEIYARFAEGLALYRLQKWPAASAAFQGALQIDPADGPSKVFIARCEYYAARPTMPDWDGVHVMHTK
jgi:adenylate cyclase